MCKLKTDILINISYINATLNGFSREKKLSHTKERIIQRKSEKHKIKNLMTTYNGNRVLCAMDLSCLMNALASIQIE